MKQVIGIISVVLFLLTLGSCGDDQNTAKKESASDLVDIKNGIYTEYYPGRKAVKFKGPQDDENLRNGRWFFYDEKGNELSMTEYVNGKKHGFIFVRYPNGSMRYTGEFNMDVESGVWKFYNEDGTISSEKDYANTEIIQ
ncbi:toxin-antitoxin system YwqK family antitoxin [Fluviicola taffensis]|uniref:MORN variant repeat-containing protein n=1 Tax=Fluviicola taffensis (strain DSM 16823 / NCIMB 13979 / RW262) TaxID=755732 RepID=F2ICM6_FLUTR|nr:MORN variant repeat-containing protein [Fluviicola taffensis]AEA42253.1 MORN variant repeat-containing protein [Fluviicola taffensis DSM 16823]